jgi:lipoprotein-releasing system permease protein
LPRPLDAAAWVGTGRAGVILLLRWLLSGALGYESQIGLRIIRTGPRAPAGPAWPSSPACWSPSAGSGAQPRITSLGLVIAVAAASFLGLLLLLVQYSSIFGTTSIVGVVLGVAALIVVQSVATGFQHEFERRVLGVYAHINVTRSTGMTEYRRFEAWLRTQPGVQGASPVRVLRDDAGPLRPGGRPHGRPAARQRAGQGHRAGDRGAGDRPAAAPRARQRASDPPRGPAQ